MDVRSTATMNAELIEIAVVGAALGLSLFGLVVLVAPWFRH
jgi:hypothetical protein